MRTSVRRLALLTAIAFIILAVYLTYIQAVAGGKLYSNPLNPRMTLEDKATWRGVIYDYKGRILARTTGTEGQFRRDYPYGMAAAHVVGYVSERFGSSGLEASRSRELLGLTGWQGRVNTLRKLTGQTKTGNNITVTLDAELQQLATALLAGRPGAVVALEPKTGAVRVMVSSPSFNPNRLAEEWEQINLPESGSPLLNRALQGLYPPGSIMKIVTAAAALEKNQGLLQEEFFCPGYIDLEGWRLTCPRAHEEVDFQQAMMFSCNVSFAKMVGEAGATAFLETARAFGFNKSVSFDLPVKASEVPAQMGVNALAESAIGQGAVLATPMQMALVAAAVANRGVIMQPYLVARTSSPEGKLLWQFRPRPVQVVAGAGTVEAIKEAMVATAAEGTATAVSVPGIRVAAKTGTAQNPRGDAHAWLVAFAPAEDPQIAVAVIIENAGSGGVTAAPVAREIIAAALRR